MLSSTYSCRHPTALVRTTSYPLSLRVTITHYSHTSPALASQKHSCNFHFFYSSPPFALPVPSCSKTRALLPGAAASWSSSMLEKAVLNWLHVAASQVWNRVFLWLGMKTLGLSLQASDKGEPQLKRLNPMVLMWKYSQALPTSITDQQIFHSVLPSLAGWQVRQVPGQLWCWLWE